MIIDFPFVCFCFESFFINRSNMLPYLIMTSPTNFGHKHRSTLYLEFDRVLVTGVLEGHSVVILVFLISEKKMVL